MRRAKKPAEGINWGVFLIRKKAERLGRIQAPDAETARKLSAEKFQISEAERGRISVMREA